MILPGLFVLLAADRPTTPVTFDAPILSLTDVCRAMAKKTGIAFDCAPNIADRKATLLCEKRPADDVMARMEAGMFLRFEPRGGGFLLVADPDVQNEELRYERSRAEARLAAARDGIRRLVAFARVPADQRASEAKGAEKTYQEAKTPEDRQNAYADYALRQGMERGDRSWWDAGSVLGQLSPPEIEGLLAGRPVLADNAELGTGHALPAGSWAYSMPMSKGRGIMATFQYRPETGDLNFSQRSMPTDGGSGAMMMSVPLARQEPKEHALTDRIAAWAKGRDAKVDDTAIPEGTDVPVCVSPRRVLAMPEHFAWIHRRTGIPIVAEVTRGAVSYPEPFRAKTVVGWMEATRVRQGYSGSWTSYNFRTDQGWLMARPGDLLRIRRVEPTERQMAPYAGKEELTLDEMARYAGSLNEDQLRGLDERTWALPLPQARLKMAIDALRVYDALGNAKRAAYGPSGVSWEAMSPVARQRLEALFVRRLLNGWPETSLVPFLTGAARLNQAPMTFRIETTTLGTMIEEALPDTRSGYTSRDSQNYESLAFRSTLAGQVYDDYLPFGLKKG